MNVVVLSDLHFGAEDRTAIAAAGAYVTASAPDAILVAGDLSMYGRRRELDAASAWLQTLAAPVVSTPGNHDTPFWDVVARTRAPFARYASYVDGFATQSFLGPDFAVRSVTTARGAQLRANWAHGSIDLVELTIAAQALGEAGPRTIKIILGHHPLISPATSPLSGRTRRGLQAAHVCARAGVDLVISGHLHTPFLEPLPAGDRLTYAVGCGTLSERLRGVPPSILHLSTRDDVVEATIVDCSAPQAVRADAITAPLRPR